MSFLYCKSVGTTVCFWGMCALEMTALELTDNGEKGGQVVSCHFSEIYSHHHVFYRILDQVTAETIQKCIESLEDEQQKDFIRQCLVTDPARRPKARDLLFHPILFEVGRGSFYIPAETACLLRFSVLIAHRYILSNFSPPTPLSRTQVWIDVNFLLGCYWLLDMIWARRSNTSENSVSFSITTFSCLNYAEPIFLQEFDIRKVRLKVFGVKYHSSAQQAHRPRQTQLTKYYF